MATHTPLLEICARLFAAVLFGMLIGWDRELRNKPAGLRTHMMVSLGSASATLVAIEWFCSAPGGSAAAGDPTRVIQGIVGGLGFLGAGSIIQGRDGVHGVTTAAGIWVVGAIGIECGAGQFAIAGVTVLLALFILNVMLVVERRIGGRNNPQE